ncbi:hypothetical protein ABTD83_19530, partial [Acinetobacter baumannii]
LPDCQGRDFATDAADSGLVAKLPQDLSMGEVCIGSTSYPSAGSATVSRGNQRMRRDEVNLSENL